MVIWIKRTELLFIKAYIKMVVFYSLLISLREDLIFLISNMLLIMICLNRSELTFIELEEQQERVKMEFLLLLLINKILSILKNT